MIEDFQIKNAIWAFVFFVLIIPVIILRGIAVKLLWLWFMVPFGLPIIGFAWAVGLAAFAIFITNGVSIDTKIESDKHDMKKLTMWTITNPLSVIIFGFIFSFFV